MGSLAAAVNHTLVLHSRAPHFREGREVKECVDINVVGGMHVTCAPGDSFLERVYKLPTLTNIKYPN